MPQALKLNLWLLERGQFVDKRSRYFNVVEPRLLSIQMTEERSAPFVLFN